MYFCYSMLKKGGVLLLIMYATTCAAQQNIHSDAPIQKAQYEFVPNQGQWHPLALTKQIFRTEIYI